MDIDAVPRMASMRQVMEKGHADAIARVGSWRSNRSGSDKDMKEENASLKVAKATKACISGISGAVEWTHTKLHDKLEQLTDSDGGLRDTTILAEVTKQVDAIGKAVAAEHKARLAIEEHLDKVCSELRRDVNESIQGVGGIVNDMFEPMTHLVEQTALAIDDLRVEMEQKGEARADSVRNNFEERLRQVEQDDNGVKIVATKAANDAAAQRMEKRIGHLSDKVDSLRVELMSSQGQLEESVRDLQTLRNSHGAFIKIFNKAEGEQESKLSQIRRELDASCTRIREEFDASCRRTLAICAGEQEQMRSEYARGEDLDREVLILANSMDEILCKQQDHDNQLGYLKDNVDGSNQLDEGLRSMIGKSASKTVRSVEWLVPDAANESSEPRCLYSPTFEAAGEVGLQLELKITPAEPFCHAPDDLPVSLEGPAGACCVNLLAEGGAHLHFRFSVGHFTGPEQEHRFHRWEPSAAGQIWSLADQVGEEDGSLRIVVEFLEARRSEPVNPVRKEPTGESQHGSCGTIVRHHHQYHLTHLLPNLLEDMRRSGEARFRPRGLRYVEWTVKKASSLKQLYPKGQCIWSNPFSAAGFEGLQLMFYPQGCERAPLGYSSCFLRLRPGEYIQGVWLRVGTHRWEAEWQNDTPGLVGCSRFLLTEQALDASSDTLLLTLELQAASNKIVYVGSVGDPDMARDWRPSSARGNSAVSNSPKARSPIRELAVHRPPSARCTSAHRRRHERADNMLPLSAKAGEWKMPGYQGAAALGPWKMPPAQWRL